MVKQTTATLRGAAIPAATVAVFGDLLEQVALRDSKFGTNVHAGVVVDFELGVSDVREVEAGPLYGKVADCVTNSIR